MRVHELAKQFDVPSKELVIQLRDLGMDVKSHMSSLSPQETTQAQTFLRSGGSSTAATATATAEPSPAEETESDEAAPEEAPSEEDSKTITIKGPVVVREFAEMLKLKPNQLIAGLMGMNIFASINEKLEVKTAQQLAQKFGYTVQQEKKKKEVKPPPPKKKEEVIAELEVDVPEALLTRPPSLQRHGNE